MSLEKSLQKIIKKNCIIEIFGLGYIGFPISIRLAKAGFKIVGIDKNKQKLDRLEKGDLINFEINHKKTFFDVRKKGKFFFSRVPEKSTKPKIAIICVPTPIPSKKINSDFYVVCAIENFLSTCNKGDSIIIESSIEVGTIEKIQKHIEKKGFEVGKNFGLSYCPERIDPLNVKWSIHNIPRVIYCSDDVTYEIAKNIYKYVNKANLVKVSSPRVAEIVKSFENAFRLVNISLVNELAILCEKLNVNVSEVIKAASTKPFGFMPFYTSAGAGGHCIPKDPIFLLNSSKKYGINFHNIESAIKINSEIPSYIAQSIKNTLSKVSGKKIIVWGLTYKENVNDMRDSPGIKLIQKLKSLGYEVVGYDPYYDGKLKDFYFLENNLIGGFDFLNEIDDKFISKFNCIVVVQHHNLVKNKLEAIYQKSLVPVIYDCQSRLKVNPDSKTILKFFGNNEKILSN
jgi:UDP-N-acetyl-D-glucosamine dehydrogenase